MIPSLWLGGISTLIALCGFGCSGSNLSVNTSAISTFEQVVQRSIPPTAHITEISPERTSDTSSSTFGMGPGAADREVHIAFTLNQKLASEWLSEVPPWGSKWVRGDVPDSILKKTKFFGRIDGESLEYAVNERCCSEQDSDFSYWNGDILIIDRDTGRVWFASWDM